MTNIQRGGFNRFFLGIPQHSLSFSSSDVKSAVPSVYLRDGARYIARPCIAQNISVASGSSHSVLKHADIHSKNHLDHETNNYSSCSVFLCYGGVGYKV